jgi:hypothetical protein
LLCQVRFSLAFQHCSRVFKVFFATYPQSIVLWAPIDSADGAPRSRARCAHQGMLLLTQLYGDNIR